jgi:hypothetical protein
VWWVGWGGLHGLPPLFKTGHLEKGTTPVTHQYGTIPAWRYKPATVPAAASPLPRARSRGGAVTARKPRAALPAPRIQRGRRASEAVRSSESVEVICYARG